MSARIRMQNNILRRI